MTTIDYYFAVQSPWSYFGHRRLVAIAARHQATIRPLPMDLGAIFPVSGGLPLAQRSPQRRAYRLVELARWSRHLGLPIHVEPTHFPTGGRDAALVCTLAGERHGPDASMAVAEALMKALWADDRNLEDLDTVAAAADQAGLPGQALVADRAAAGERFAQNTRQALAAGVFGAPWYVVGGEPDGKPDGEPCGEPFWGQDRLELLDLALGRAAR